MAWRRFFPALLFLCLFAGSSAGAQPESPLRKPLEQAWREYVAASRSGTERDLERTMSSYYFATIANNLARAGRAMTPPNHYATVVRYAPELERASFVAVLENGPTAGLVYVRDSQYRDSGKQQRVDFFVMKFVDEGRGWKVDGSMTINTPRILPDGKPAPFDPAKLQPDYRIDGRIRAAPARNPVQR